jgi:hypothetical protein
MICQAKNHQHYRQSFGILYLGYVLLEEINQPETLIEEPRKHFLMSTVFSTVDTTIQAVVWLNIVGKAIRNTRNWTYSESILLPEVPNRAESLLVKVCCSLLFARLWTRWQ